MRGFLADYWWILSVNAFALAFVAYRWRSRAKFSRPSNARSFAAVRVFRRDELHPYFGTYLPQALDLAVYLLFAVWFAVLALVASFDLGVTSRWVAAVAGAVALVSATVDAQSKRIIGPDRIAFESPVDALSWTIPLSQVTQCDLVRGRPHSRLRVHADQGSYSLPLTNELWQKLSAGSPTPP